MEPLEPRPQHEPPLPADSPITVRPSDGLAVASLVLGILACISFWIFPVCAIFAVVSVLLGRVAQRRMRQATPLRPAARSWATAGIVLSFSGVLLSSALLGSCYCLVQDAAKKGQLEFSKEIQDLEKDPEFKRQLEELRKDVKALDEQKNEAQKPDDNENE
ncbi:MAG: DUF4190 domain-containing protein [Deltaproteobacteria bacterium]|nr:DUF4190 domain-containing protein [Deltaproteobacteria bacterium]